MTNSLLGGSILNGETTRRVIAHRPGTIRELFIYFLFFISSLWTVKNEKIVQIY